MCGPPHACGPRSRSTVMNPVHPGTVRLAHFSDIHVTAPAVWRRSDWFNKRFSAWVNLRLLGRSHTFRLADQVLTTLAADLRTRSFDWLVFSGAASAMGFE